MSTIYMVEEVIFSAVLFHGGSLIWKKKKNLLNLDTALLNKIQANQEDFRGAQE